MYVIFCVSFFFMYGRGKADFVKIIYTESYHFAVFMRKP